MIDQAGNTDTAGNGWNISTGDVTIDQDSADNVASRTDSTPATFTTAGSTPTVVKFNANEDIDCSSVETSDVHEVEPPQTGSRAWRATRATDVITVTMSGATLATGNSVTLEARTV